ncbi:MAG: 2-C-methyl-D-erythritol 4-phosphate cytidylyltransferase [Muribaculaceae bacterium]|nr:2-C-methyl-D-erythritol 4-phosphate cytidylyltransferase [Muribaculaceae bacterium]
MVNSEAEYIDGRDINVVVVAAGSGSRYGACRPKQFLPLAGKPVVMRAIDCLRCIFPRANMFIVISEAENDNWKLLCEEYGFESPRVVFGGASRTESVENALEAIKTGDFSDAGVTMIHDGARPIVNGDMCRALYRVVASGKALAAAPGYTPTDSMADSCDVHSALPIDRSKLRCVQTPQTFDTATLLASYSLARAAGEGAMSDDTAVVAKYGKTGVYIVEGDRNNIKITHPADIKIAEILLDSPLPYAAPQ